jgi:hypothetical protein
VLRAVRVAALVAALMLVGSVGPALADPPPACPDRPADAQATADPVVAELRAARQDASVSCVALAARLDLVRDLDQGVVTNTADIRAALVDPAGLPVNLADLGTALEPLVVTPDVPAAGASDSNPAFVQVASADTTQAVTSDAAGVLVRALWFLVGLLACIPFSFFFLRAVMP